MTIDTTMTIPVKKLSSLATIPTRGSEEAAGWDLYAATDKAIIIPPHETVKIKTDLAFQLPRGTFAGIFARSGIAAKRSLRPSNCVGVIDSDYRGECIVALHNDSEDDQKIEPKERIAQMILLPFVEMNFNEVEDLSDTNRGDGGFGSSGTK